MLPSDPQGSLVDPNRISRSGSLFSLNQLGKGSPSNVIVKPYKFVNYCLLTPLIAVAGFKDKQDDHHKPPNRRLNTSRDLRLSNESLGSKNHSRNLSDSGSNNSSGGNSTGGGFPPSGQRVVLGRETTPTPGQGHNGESGLSSSPRDANHNSQGGKDSAGPTRIPKDVWERFEGASREASCFPCLFELGLYRLLVAQMDSTPEIVCFCVDLPNCYV